jgi:hypothetical protein
MQKQLVFFFCFAQARGVVVVNGVDEGEYDANADNNIKYGEYFT